MGDPPDNSDHGSGRSPGQRQYTEGYFPQVQQQQQQQQQHQQQQQQYYQAQYPSPSPQPTASRSYPVAYPRSIPYGPNYQPVAYPGGPSMTIPAFYYNYGQSPHAPPQYAYSNDSPGAPSRDASQIYAESRSGNIALSQHHGPGQSQNPYAHMVYPPPGPYQYPGPTSAPVSSQYSAAPQYGGIPRMDHSPDPWYYAANPGPPPGTAEYDSRQVYSTPPQRQFPGHAMEPHSSSYLSPGPPPTHHRAPSELLHSSASPPASTTSPRPSSSTFQTFPTSPQPVPPVPSERARQKARDVPGRRPYQPNPPANRSEWVMWVGNIPADSTHEELLQFFQSVPSLASAPSSPTSEQHSSINDASESGVLSVFLISQSNCAFVNFESEVTLLRAVSVCNGRPLRPYDPKCLKLVCRVRKRDEDLRAGVGAQRGMGMHTRWVHEQKAKSAEGNTSASSASVEESDDAGRAGPPRPPLSVLGGREGARHVPSEPRTPPYKHDSADERPSSLSPVTGKHESSSGSVSFTSTNSSFLANNYPQRYFILKSLSQHDLNTSVERKLWATQPHNEPILDQAYRTSQDVFLIFGANKSGEFFGYARMAGPIANAENRHVSWAARGDGSSSHVAGSSSKPDPIQEELETDPISNREPPFLSPAERPPLRESPMQVSSEDVRQPPPPTEGLRLTSAPTEVYQPFQRLSAPAHQRGAATFEDKVPFVLDKTAPERAIRHHSANSQPIPRTKTEADSLPQMENLTLEESPAERPEGSSLPPAGEPKPAGAGWGTPFPVEWIRVQRLPFHRTRHLRNPWNTDREVKVSRDGTELEPEVGRRLLAEWDDLPPQTGAPTKRPSSASRPSASRAR